MLLSDQTPWRNLKRAGIGSDLALSQMPLFARFIEETAGQSPEQTEAIHQRVMERAAQIADVSADLAANRRLFQSEDA